MVVAWRDFQRIALIQVQDPVLGHGENHKIHIGPLLKPDKIPVWCIFPGVYQLHNAVLCHLQTCWRWSQSHYLLSLMKTSNSSGPSMDPWIASAVSASVCVYSPLLLVYSSVFNLLLQTSPLLLWSLPETVTRFPDFPWAVSSSPPFYTKQLTSNISPHFLCLFNSFLPALPCLSENAMEFRLFYCSDCPEFCMTKCSRWAKASRDILCIFVSLTDPSQAPTSMCQFYFYLSSNSSPVGWISLHGMLVPSHKGYGSQQVKKEEKMRGLILFRL